MDIKWTVKVQLHGGSNTISIPKSICTALDIKKGDEVDYIFDGTTFRIEKHKEE